MTGWHVLLVALLLILVVAVGGPAFKQFKAKGTLEGKLRAANSREEFLRSETRGRASRGR